MYQTVGVQPALAQPTRAKMATIQYSMDFEIPNNELEPWDTDMVFPLHRYDLITPLPEG